MASYVGACHCGIVHVEFRTERDPNVWPLRQCTCSFCIRFAGVYTSDPAGAIAIQTNAELKRYQFGQRTAEFLFCPNCGVYFGATALIGDARFGVLSVRVLERVLLDHGKAKPMDFDDETVELRTARRRQNWTPMTIAEPPE